MCAGGGGVGIAEWKVAMGRPNRGAPRVRATLRIPLEGGLGVERGPLEVQKFGFHLYGPHMRAAKTARRGRVSALGKVRGMRRTDLRKRSARRLDARGGTSGNDVEG
jgi:hypothetical protein